MPQIIVAPDDTEIEFPDDTPDSVIQQVMQREYGPKPVQAIPRDAPEGNGFPYSDGPLGDLPMGNSLVAAPAPDTSFGSALGSSLAGGAIKSVAGISNAIGRNVFKTNEEEQASLQAQLAELEQNGQGNDFFAQRSRQMADTVRGRLASLQARPENPLIAPIQESARDFAKNLQGFNEEVIQPYYGANPASQNVGAQIARGLGGFINAAPLMAVPGGAGLALGAGQMASVAYQDTYEQVLNETGDETLAAEEAGKAAATTGPALLAYMAGGKLAGSAAAKLLGETATPLAKGALGTAAATASNVAVGSTIRALEGQDWKPTVENLTMDALFGLVHGAGEYGKASQEARQRASDELRARGVPEEAATPVAPKGEAETSPSDAPPVDLSKFGNRVDVEAGVVETPEGKIDVATGVALDPVREQSLKSLGRLQEEAPLLDVSLEPVSRETFQREMGQDVLEDHIAFRDPTSKQVVQVPKDATPEQIAETVKAARAEEAAALQRAQADEAAAAEERAVIEQARQMNAEDTARRMEEFRAQGAGVDPTTVRKRTPAPVEESVRTQENINEPVWNNPLRLKNLRNEMVLKRRKDPSYGGTAERFNASIKEMDERLKFLMSDESTPERTSPDITPTRDGTQRPTSESPGASNISELQQQQVIAGADIQKGLTDSLGEAPSRELWEKNFLREYPEMEGDTATLDRVYRNTVRAADQAALSPTKPMPEVVQQLDNPIPEGVAVSTKNESVNANRQERNLGPLEAEGVRDFGTVWEDASRIVNDNPQEQFRLINELKENPRAVTDTENAIILRRMIELRNQADREYANLDAAYERGDRDQIQEALGRQRLISDELAELEVISNRVGTATARGLGARRMMAMQDFSRARMEQRMRAEKGGEPLTPEESVKIKELSEKITSTQEAFDLYRVQMEEKVSQMEAQKAVTKIVEKVKKEDAKPAAAKKTSIDKATAWLKTKADEARARIQERKSKGQAFSGGINPEELDDYIIIGASKVAEGLGNFAKWSKSMVEEFGETIRPYLKNIFDKAGGVAKEAPKQMTQEEQRNRLIQGIQNRVAEGDSVDQMGRYIQQLAENAVRGGIREREPLVQAVHTVLKDIVPGITQRDVQDSISGYGKFRQLSQDEVKVKLRDLKGQLQQVSKIEDMQAKIAPKKTGVQRREPSDEERRLIKQVNELKKAGGFTVTDPATQLKTALGAVKTRLRNQIADLDLALSTKQPIPNKKGGVPYDQEANILKASRDALKEQYDAIFQKPGLTDEQRIQQAKTAVERSIKEYEDRIKNGELSRRKKEPGPTNQELQVLRDERDALKAELDELRASDSWLQEQRQQESLKQSIAGLEEKLSQGEPVKAEKQGPESKEVTDLRARKEALQKQLQAVREASPERLQERIDTTEESLRKSIEEYDKKLQTGDLSKRTTKPPLSTPEIDSLRSELDAMRRLYQELQNAAKPKLSPEEVALKAAKSRLKTMKAQYERKLAAGDFEPRKPKEFPKDAEFLKLKAENTLAKEEYMRALFDARMAARPEWKKFVGKVGEGLNLSRAVLTSADLSAVLRQGGFIAFGNPVRAAKAIRPMLLATGLTPASSLSALKAAGKQLVKGNPIRAAIDAVKTVREYGELMQKAVMEEIKSDPAYQAAEQAKLFLSDNDGITMNKLEEQFVSRLAKYVPGVGASGRAYSTFLNKLRFDTFKAMTETLTKSGTPTPAEAKAIANYINVATGRGSVHQSLAQATAGLNMLFFAPRYVTSRFQLLLGQPFYGGTARTRTLIAKEYGKMLAGAALVYGLGLAAGAKVNGDSKSSDFLKMRFGDTRVDPLFGLIQATTLLSRESQGKTTTNQGVVKDLTAEKKGPYDPDRLSVFTRFLRTKLAPVPGTVASLMEGKDLAGQPYGAKEALKNSVVPISFGDIAKVMEEQGIPKGTIFSILSLFGAGVQTYKTEPPKGRSSKDSFSERRSKNDL